MPIAPYRSSTELLRPLADELLRPLAGLRTGSLLRAPESDVVETPDEIRITAELPGMRSEDISIDVEKNVLTITGEKREERRQGGDARYHLTERRYGRFSRSFVLPSDVEAERIQARFEDGVLHVTIPKSEATRRRHIEIQGGSTQTQASDA